MKLSELEIRNKAIEDKIVKIAKEQQKRFDALSAEIETLKTALKEGEVPTPASESLDRVDGLLEQLDNTIIDTDPEPSAGKR